MKKTLCILLFVVMMLICMTAAVYADQDGASCWCNNDQYGCWITGEKGGRDYIMFWTESARDYIMGKGSKAPIVEKYHAGKLPLECGIVRSKVVVSAPASACPEGYGQCTINCEKGCPVGDFECMSECGPRCQDKGCEIS